LRRHSGAGKAKEPDLRIPLRAAALALTAGPALSAGLSLEFKEILTAHDGSQWVDVAQIDDGGASGLGSTGPGYGLQFGARTQAFCQTRPGFAACGCLSLGFPVSTRTA